MKIYWLCALAIFLTSFTFPAFAKRDHIIGAQFTLQKNSLSQLQKALEGVTTDLYRTRNFQHYTLLFLGSNLEGEILPEKLVIQDKHYKNRYYLVPFDGVWDAVIDEQHNMLYMGARFFAGDLEDKTTMQKLTRLAKQFGLSKTALLKRAWEENNMCGGCPTFTVLKKVNMNSLQALPMPLGTNTLFGGEELSITPQGLWLTHYWTDANTEKCWRAYATSQPVSTCNTLTLKTTLIDRVTGKVLKTAIVPTVGRINAQTQQVKWTDSGLATALVRKLFSK